VTAYATFARGGNAIVPAAVARPVPAQPRSIVSERTAFWITDILSDPNAREYAFGTGGNLDFPFPVAVKTGTSQAYRDNWTIGYTRDVTVGVWVGNFDRQPLRGSSGVTGAAPIFNAVMLAAMKRARGSLPVGDMTPVVAPPPGLASVEICALSGERPSPYCPAIQKEWVRTDQPARFCSWHHPGSIDWPAEYRSWARQNAPSPVVTKTAHATQFRITNPPNGATYLIDPTLRMQYQTLRLRAVAASGVAWQIDGRRIHTTEWPLERGIHEVTALDEQGQKDSVRIFVK
jgi:penicillin-binding protein 1C